MEDVQIVSYLFYDKSQMDFGPYPIIYKIAEKVGTVIASAPLKWHTEKINGITVRRCPVFPVPAIPNASNIIFGFGVYRKARKFDGIIHAQDLTAGFGFKLLRHPKKLLTLRSLTATWMETVPNIKPTSAISLAIKLEKMLIENSDYIISPSEYYMNEVLKRYNFDENNIEVVPNGIDEHLFSPSKKEPERNILLFCGTDDPRKGLPIALDAFNKLKGKYKDLELWIVGIENKDNIDPMIKYFGRIPNDKLPQFYRNAKILLHPSYNENCPKAILEAMSCGLPVIALDNTGQREVIRNGIDGLLAMSESFTNYVDNLLSDENLRKKIGKNGRKAILEKYTFDKMWKKYLNIYQRL